MLSTSSIQSQGQSHKKDVQKTQGFKEEHLFICYNLRVSLRLFWENKGKRSNIFTICELHKPN